MKSRLVCAAILVCLCESAWADDIGPYVYGSVGKTRANIDRSGVDSLVSVSQGGPSVVSSAQGNPMAYRLSLGYRLSPWIGLEFAYGGTRSLTYSASAPLAAEAHEKLRIWDVVAAANLPIGRGFSLTFRGGFANVRATGSDTIIRFNGSRTDVTGGAGIRYAFDRNVSVRVDWDGYTAPAAARIGQVNVYSVGVGYNF